MLINPDNNKKDLIIPESSIILANTPIKTQQSVHEKFTLVLGCPSRVPGSFERQLDDIGITNYRPSFGYCSTMSRVFILVFLSHK